MFSLFISFTLALSATYFSYFYYNVSIGWSITYTLTVFIASQLLIALILRRRLTSITEEIQDVLMKGQKKINAKLQRFQQRPGGSQKAMQRQIDTEQRKLFKEALSMTKRLEKFFSWSMMIKKQVNTMRMQFYFQMKDFEKVDELIPNCFYMDSTTYAMKMARQYKNDSDDLKKTFEKGVKKFKGEKVVIIYALYSWILVKRKNIEKAIEVLAQGKEATGNETLSKNWQFLVNKRIRNFSNASLGEAWYALHLEQFKAKPVRAKRNQKFYH